MELLTRKRARLKREREQELRRKSNADIAIYNKGGNKAFKVNPFAGDTTILPFGSGDQRFHGTPEYLTEQDLDEYLLIRGKRLHVKKNETQLTPDLVSDEVKDWYRAKIFAGAVRSAKNKKDKC